jgi:hypothetical protein
MSSARSRRRRWGVRRRTQSPDIYDGPGREGEYVNLNATTQTLTDCLVPWVANLNSKLAHPGKQRLKELGLTPSSVSLDLQWVVVTPTLVESTNILRTLIDIMALTRAHRNHYDQDYADHHYDDSTSDWSDSTNTLSMVIPAMNSS